MAKKMARNGGTKDIYKGTFICIQTLYATLAWFLTHCADGLRPFQNIKNRVKEFSIFSTVLVKTSLHKFGEPISHQIFHSPLGPQVPIT